MRKCTIYNFQSKSYAILIDTFFTKEGEFEVFSETKVESV